MTHYFANNSMLFRHLAHEASFIAFGFIVLFGAVSGAHAQSPAYNVHAISTIGTAVTEHGADNYGHAYESSLIGVSATYDGSTFTFAPADAANAWTDTTITLPAGTYTKLNMLGTAVGGNKLAQTFTVTYNDNTTSTFTLSLHDWMSHGSFPGESVVVTMASRLGTAGVEEPTTCFVRGYTFTLNGKPVQSITLPATRQVIALGFTTGDSPPATDVTTVSGKVRVP